MYSISPARPPFSAVSVLARDNLSAANLPSVQPASNTSAKLHRRSPQAKTRGGSSQYISYPHLENVDSNIGCSSCATSCSDKLSPSHGTPLKNSSKRRSNSTRLHSNSSDFESVQGECVSYTSSDVRSVTSSSDEEATTTDDSDPSLTSGSESENACRLRQASVRRQEGLRRMSLGPKIEAAVTKLEKTPSKPIRPVRINGANLASPASLRAGVQRALPLQPNMKDSSQGQYHFDLQVDPSFWDDHNVQVVIRCRPPSSKESVKQCFTRCVKQDGPQAITWLGQPETRFTFDHVAGENISQEKIFQAVGLPIVENCMAGYNSCMFAYGQTGSGKTHTMLGDICDLDDRPNEDRGITPRIFEYLFSRIQKEGLARQLEQLRYVCKCSFLEIYNEQITDLLEPSSSNLQIREDSKKGVYVENLTETAVSSVQDVVSLLLKGAANRKVASTNMNRESSRSHSVFTCTIESRWEINSLTNMRFGRLNLVDLAGSERQKSSGAEGDRLKEAASINKSLSTLGLVIMILVDVANGKPRHVPYRDSKLTFLLQDSLGGNSKTAIIATISPSICCSMETLSTLKFAQRAKFIQNNAVVNEDASDEVLALRREIVHLKHECWDDIVEQEEVARLRCQAISSIRKECRRESNEFFRMSVTGRDLFDAAEKECSDEGADLKSTELLEKIKALEAVLAGALRREHMAETVTKNMSAEIVKANKVIEEQFIELQNYKNLLRMHAEEQARLQSAEGKEPLSDPGMHATFAEKLKFAERLEQYPTVTKLELENVRLREQLHSYQVFFDSGEKETMSTEIQGLRDQILELLDRKFSASQGSPSKTIAKNESDRKELETCRNDLTKCLEASAQLQKQVDELQGLVNQLTEQCAGMEKFKEENKFSQTRWEHASSQLYHDLLEGERVLTEVVLEMDEILGEDWLLKNMQEKSVRWSIESSKSLKDVDVEHDFFKRGDSCSTDDIFGEKRNSRRKKSSGFTPRVSIMADERLKLEGIVSRLEKEIEEHKKRLLEADQAQGDLRRLQGENLRLKEEVEALTKNFVIASELFQDNVADLKGEIQELRIMSQKELDEFRRDKCEFMEDIEALTLNSLGFFEDNADLKGEAQELRLQLQEQNEALELSRALTVALEENLHKAEQDQKKLEIEERDKLELKELEDFAKNCVKASELLTGSVTDLKGEIQELQLKLREEFEEVQREKSELKEEMEAMVKNSLEFFNDNADLKGEVHELKLNLREQSEALELSQALTAELEKNLTDLEQVKSHQAEILELKVQEASRIQEECLKFQKETVRLSLESEDFKKFFEQTEQALVSMTQINLELTEENAQFKFQAGKAGVLQTTLVAKNVELEAVLKTCQQEISELETEIERLELSLHEVECRYQELETTSKADEEAIAAVEFAKQKLDSEVKMVSSKLTSTDAVQEELRMTVSLLHVELETKIQRIGELELQLESKAELLAAYVKELKLSAADLESHQMRIFELEESLEKKSKAMELLEEALTSATATCDAVRSERDEARVLADQLQLEVDSSGVELQELRDRVVLNSFELEIFMDVMESVSSNFQIRSQTLSQELEHERVALGELQHHLLSLTTTLETNHAALCESRIKEQNLLADLLRVREQLSSTESDVREVCEVKTILEGEVLTISEALKNKNLENDVIKGEIAAVQAQVLNYQRITTANELRFGTDAQAITLLNETIEHLRVQLQRKEDLLLGLEFDISLLQEHAAEDTDLKQGLLEANIQVGELQGKVQIQWEELKELALAKSNIGEQFARLSADMELKKDQLSRSEMLAALKTEESRALTCEVSQLQTSLSSLVAEVAEKNEALGSLDKELALTRLALTHMSAECDHKNESLMSVQSELLSVSAEKDDLRAQCSILVEQVGSLQGKTAHQVAEMEDMQGKLSLFTTTETCLQELKLEIQTMSSHSKSQEAAYKVELAQSNERIQQLNLWLSNASERAFELTQEHGKLEAYIAELQTVKDSLDAQLAQRNEAEKSSLSQVSTPSESTNLFLAEKEAMKCEIDDLQRVNCSLKTDLALRVDAMVPLESEIMVTRNRLAQLEEKVADQESTISALQEKRHDMEIEIALKSDAVNLVAAELSAAQTVIRSLVRDLEDTKQQVAAFGTEQVTLEAKIVQEDKAIRSMNVELTAANEANSCLESLRLKLAEVEVQKGAIEKELRTANRRLIELQDKFQETESLAALKTDTASPVTAELSAALAVNSSLAQNLKDANQRIVTLFTENECLATKILQKDDEITSVKTELSAASNAVMCLESLRLKLADLELQKDSVTQQLAETEESNNSLTLELAEKIKALSSLQDEFKIALESSTASRKVIKTMESEINALLLERDSWQTELNLQLSTVISLQSELVEARSSAQSSKDSIAALESKVEALQTERDSMKIQMTGFNCEFTEALNSLQLVENDLSESRRVLDWVSAENAALQAQVVGLQSEKGTFEEELSFKIALIMSLEAELVATSSSCMDLRKALNSSESQVADLQTMKAALELKLAENRASISLRESELLSTNTVTISKVQESDELITQVKAWQQKCRDLESQLDSFKAQVKQQDLQLASLEELLARESEALRYMTDSANHATQECDSLKSEVDGLKEILCTNDTALKEQEAAFKTLEGHLNSVGNETEKLRALGYERDQALVEIQALHGELRAAQALVASHKASALEAQKFAEANILRASGKEEEARTLRVSVSALKNQKDTLEKQLEATKNEADRLRLARDEFEMELQGMKNRMTMLQAVHSTGSRNFKGFQAAQAASLDLQKRLEEKEAEVSQMYKRMTALRSQNEAQSSRLEEMEAELTHVHQELDDLQSQCEGKDAQLKALNEQLKEAETLTQDVMRDLHNVKLDISNYASLVSQQQLELISERARHSDNAREKDEELSNLQTQLNQERQNWMVEMNHKQAEIVVARVLSEKMRQKNKTLAAEYKRLKVDYQGKKKKLKFLEQQLTQLTTETRRFSMGTESEADFDEVQQFKALLAQANDHERAQRN